MDNDALVDAVARKLAPFVCSPVHNGDNEDIAAGQSHARYIARAIIPLIEAEKAAAFRAGELAMRERAAGVAEKRADGRFEEFGVREPDTNATYYDGRQAEILEELDEEDWFIRDAIRALKPTGGERGA